MKSQKDVRAPVGNICTVVRCDTQPKTGHPTWLSSVSIGKVRARLLLTIQWCCVLRNKVCRPCAAFKVNAVEPTSTKDFHPPLCLRILVSTVGFRVFGPCLRKFDMHLHIPCDAKYGHVDKAPKNCVQRSETAVYDQYCDRYAQ